MTAESKFAVRWTLGECRGSSSKKNPAPHQTVALAKMSDWYRTSAPEKGGILALPTGGGKTFTAIWLSGG